MGLPAHGASQRKGVRDLIRVIGPLTAKIPQQELCAAAPATGSQVNMIHEVLPSGDKRFVSEIALLKEGDGSAQELVASPSKNAVENCELLIPLLPRTTCRAPSQTS